ncbi:hypothetical protein LP416_19420 [Polaromonas sp. P2-4]|nr:hypothetical protein LP416_19420 [Polaromonas sp. P2-4]
MKQDPFSGPWRIVWMSDWDQDYVDMDVSGHVTFGAGRSGSFQFGLVQGQMDCKIDKRQGLRIEFTWHGFDEGDELTGRGHAEIVGGELQGHLYIHLGDDSAFRAVRQTGATSKPAHKRKTN